MGSNKFATIGIFLMLLIVSGIIYQKFYRPPELAPVQASGKTTVIKMCSRQNKWFFDPQRPEVNVGDKVKIQIFNQDTYDHGLALETFGVNKRIFPRRETEIEFVATKVGEFPFYCSVPCGEGHYRQRGVLIVKPQGEEVVAQALSSECQ